MAEVPPRYTNTKPVQQNNWVTRYDERFDLPHIISEHDHTTLHRHWMESQTPLMCDAEKGREETARLRLWTCILDEQIHCTVS